MSTRPETPEAMASLSTSAISAVDKSSCMLTAPACRTPRNPTEHQSRAGFGRTGHKGGYLFPHASPLQGQTACFMSRMAPHKAAQQAPVLKKAALGARISTIRAWQRICLSAGRRHGPAASIGAERTSNEKVEAIIKPFKLDEVKEALQELGFQGITVTEAKGFGRQKGHTELIAAPSTLWTFFQGKIEIVLSDEMVEKAIEAIRRNLAPDRSNWARKIFVSNIEEAIRIRTGESGLDAI